MLFFVDFINFILNIQVAGPPQSCEDLFQLCHTYSFKAIAAAFATQGYWVQADLLDMLTFTQFGHWAPLVYLIAATGGLVAVALGQPPRNYMWFFIGPAVYAFLIESRTQVTGVEWRTGFNKPQDQREVWKLAEPGLINTNQAKKMWDTGLFNYDADVGPDTNVRVSQAFLWFDQLLSSSIHWMVDWVSPHSMEASYATGGGETNIPTFAGSLSWSLDRSDWLLMTDAKWGFMEDITGAVFHDNSLRDVFIDFMASECGDEFTGYIDNTRFVRAAQAEGDRIPRTLFRSNSAGGVSFPNYLDVAVALRSRVIPMPYNLKKLFSEGGVGSFRESTDFVSIGLIDWIQSHDAIRCDTLLDIIISAFRWESGHVYQLMMQNAPASMTDEQVVYSLFYGWDFGAGAADICDLQRFMQNLILVHLIRNEMEVSPPLISARRNSSDKVVEYTESFVRSTGSKAKFGEVYTWALMIPYIQGVLLYVLAIGYPFACIVMLIPGWHKVIFTWGTFWLWVKLWDLGFAIVAAVERSVWAMMGNHFTSEALHDRVLEMEAMGQVNVYCIAPGGGCPVGAPSSCMGGCTVCGPDEIPQVDLLWGSSGVGFGPPDHTTFFENMAIFDRSLAIGANLDYDLSNGYYIYIMAALYFAVPAITGQVVLGAKAGAAGLVSTAISGSASEAGRAAQSGYVADLTQRGKSVSNALGQAAYGKSLRTSGLASQYYGLQNQQAGAEMGANALGTFKELAGSAREAHGLSKQGFDLQSANADTQVGGALTTAKRFSQAGRANAQDRTSSSSTPTTSGPTNTGLANAALGDGGDVPTDQPNLAGDTGTGSELTAGGAGRVSGDRLLQNETSSVPGSQSTPGAAGNVYGRGPDASGTTPTSPRPQSGDNVTSAGVSYNTSDAINDAANTGFSMMLSQGKASYGMSVFDSLQDLNVRSAQAGMAQFGQGMTAKGLGMHAGRVQAQADFGAQMARWNAQTGHALAVGDKLAAKGVMAGAFDPGPKPMQIDGMAMSGMLNSQAGGDVRKKANFFNNSPAFSGGWFTQLGNKERGLNAAMGPGQIANTYKSWGAAEVVGYSAKSYGQLGNKTFMFGASGPQAIRGNKK